MPWVFDFQMNQKILVEMLDFCTNRKLEHIFQNYWFSTNRRITEDFRECCFFADRRNSILEGSRYFALRTYFERAGFCTDRKFEYSYIVWKMLVSTSRRISQAMKVQSFLLVEETVFLGAANIFGTTRFLLIADRCCSFY